MGIILALLYTISVITQLLFAAGGKNVQAFFAVTAVVQMVVFYAVWTNVPETAGKDFHED